MLTSTTVTFKKYSGWVRRGISPRACAHVDVHFKVDTLTRKHDEAVDRLRVKREIFDRLQSGAESRDLVAWELELQEASKRREMQGDEKAMDILRIRLETGLFFFLSKSLVANYEVS